MTKQAKFLLFVQVILAARNIKEKKALILINDALKVSEDELNNKNAFTEQECADEFLNWRTNYFVDHTWMFDSAPKWLTQETISKILVG